MSQRALLLAVRDQLKASLAYPAAQCEVMDDGQPPPNAGELFVAVHPGNWTGEDIEGLAERYGVRITVTVRAARIPRDRWGPSLIAGTTGQVLDQELERIRAALHLDKGAYPCLARANATIGASANGFVEPLRFRDGGQPTKQYAAWFSADVKGDSARVPVGLSQTLTFGDARRYQTVESQT